MRPRLFTAENHAGLALRAIAPVASMRPRLFTAENGRLLKTAARLYAASMRPRLFTAENGCTSPTVPTPDHGFNEAAALHRGKLTSSIQYQRTAGQLQ